MQPNLVFLMSDQQSRDGLGCYGNPDAITPRLDALAGESIRARHAVANCPVCTPARGILISGMHPLRNGALHNDYPLLTGNGPGLGETLRDHGYRTGWIGKWHLHGGDRNRPVPPGPHRHGFDHTFLTNNCQLDFRPGHGFHFDDHGNRVRYDDWEPYAQTDHAVQFIEDATRDSAPFALFVSWHPPHDIGFQTDDPLVWNYDTEPDLMALHDPQRINLRPGTADTPGIRRAVRGWHAMGTGIDRCVGTIVDTLTRLGVIDNTVLVYTSDHGDSLGSHGRTVPKDAPEDVSCGVPLLIRLPEGERAGSTTDNVIGTLDLMPTLLGLLGVSVPTHCDGRDLADALRDGDESASRDAPLFYLTPFAWRGVYDREGTFAEGRFLQFAWVDGQRAMVEEPMACLYRRDDDPHQLNNRYDDPEVADLQERLADSTRRWCGFFGDPVPTPAALTAAWGTPSTAPSDASEQGTRQRPLDRLRAVGT
jgi:arylsulfatase A-like enzyme